MKRTTFFAQPSSLFEVTTEPQRKINPETNEAYHETKVKIEKDTVQCFIFGAKEVNIGDKIVGTCEMKDRPNRDNNGRVPYLKVMVTEGEAICKVIIEPTKKEADDNFPGNNFSFLRHFPNGYTKHVNFHVGFTKI